MPEFGDEFIIESYKLPWLIWIQLLVMILLIILLFFGFTVFNSETSSSSAAASPSNGSAAAPPPNPNSSDRSTNAEDHSVRMNDGELIREENQSGEESSSKDSMFFRIFRHPTHPCNYIGVVKRAFFKCFGLDSSSELSSSHQHEKQD
ncbi:hypothetical protein BUALT_Bualt11G0010600 [Buddleja alternifolia]|uniref:ATP synthase F0 subunit 8 n=1 Tax=Buddleja alternifolia TaxID=168488 RepID=A0AAV6WZP3_9LAMI|nr:hypothetical protein BUALT_Bualt11G0010600 [Buddleja alternifolia]